MAAVGGFALLAAAGVIALAGTNGSETERGRPGESAPISWQLPAGSIPAAERTGIRDALRPTAAAADAEGRTLTVIAARVASGWATVYGGLGDRRTRRLVESEPLMVLMRKTGSRWRAVSPEGGRFCAALRQTPGAVLSPTDKRYFVECEQR